MSITPNDLVLVTGASGFIASWVVAFLLQKGCNVRATVRDATNLKKLSHLTSLPGASERLHFVNLDLSKSTPEEYAKIVEGVTLVAHMASPFPSSAPKDEDELIKPAVEGTLGVLRACVNSPTVRSIVVTSSVASAQRQLGPGEKTYTEKDWPDLSKSTPYGKSKCLAEKSAWDFYEEKKPNWALCTINPAFVIGPTLAKEASGTSMTFAARLINGSSSMVPRLCIGAVDVRDVARAHVAALNLPKEKVNGRRFLLYNQTKWMLEFGPILQPTFGEMGYVLPKREAPYALLWVASFFDKALGVMLPNIGKYWECDNGPSKEILGLQYIPLEQTVTEGCHSLVYHGVIAKTEKYAPPSPDWTPGKFLESTK